MRSLIAYSAGGYSGFDDHRVTLPTDDSLVPCVSEACAAYGRRADVNPEDVWIRVDGARRLMVEQGWKVHVSAIWAAAQAVLDRVLPVLLSEDIAFKVIASGRLLDLLNEGDLGRSQIGKFLTVYPENDAQAVRIAARLHTATVGLRGPRIPSDRPLVPGSLVHYRYGSFGHRRMQSLLGSIEPALLSPEGELVPDAHVPFYQAPPWAVDPFVGARVATAPDDPRDAHVIGDRFLVVSVFHRSPSGGIYLAVDTATPCRCVLKKAERDASVGGDGRDAQERLRHEARVLAHLGPLGLSPRPLELIEDGGDLYLAMEDVEGTTLEQHVVGVLGRGVLPSEDTVIPWGRQLAEVLGAIHTHHCIYRDLKSNNVIVTPRGTLRLVDFEIASWSGDATAPNGMGTRGYCSPQQRAGDAPAATDDIYSVGALLYFVSSGAEPSQAPRPFSLLDRPLVLMNPKVSPALADVIGRCLAHDPRARFQTMDELGAALQAIEDERAPDAVHREFDGGRPSPRQAHGAFVPGRDDQIVRKLGESLCEEVRLSVHASARGSLVDRDLNDGVAGALLMLAEIVATLGDPRHRDVLAEGSRWLASAPRPEGAPLPGLCVGEAGIAAALLRAGQVLRATDFVSAAVDRGEQIAQLPHASPDFLMGRLAVFGCTSCCGTRPVRPSTCGRRWRPVRCCSSARRRPGRMDCGGRSPRATAA